jgi:hypothetical protein
MFHSPGPVPLAQIALSELKTLTFGTMHCIGWLPTLDLKYIERNLLKYFAPFLSNPQQQHPKKLRELHAHLVIMYPKSIANFDGVCLLQVVSLLLPSIIAFIADIIQYWSLSTLPKITSSITVQFNTPRSLPEKLGFEKRLREALNPLISASGGEPIGAIEWRDDPHRLRNPFAAPCY